VSQKKVYNRLRKKAITPLKINIFEWFKTQKNRAVQKYKFSLELDHNFSGDWGNYFFGHQVQPVEEKNGVNKNRKIVNQYYFQVNIYFSECAQINS